jgi:peptidoglycan/LPS O-acetylase OafA/YrhL
MSPSAVIKTEQDRIGFVDGLRGVAILLVLGYHYFHRWAARGYYPYGDMLADFPVFAYGHHGVDLFFAVSGFVIAMTLERTRGILEFGIKRMARLWPAMILCSTLTYAFLVWQPIFFPQSPKNFLSSWTFLSGTVVWSRIFPGFNSGWIDGAYWSLFVEVRFYLLAALCYYSGRGVFWRWFPILSAIAVAAYWLADLLHYPTIARNISDFTIAPYLPWFLLGLSMYCRWKADVRMANFSMGIALIEMILVSTTFDASPSGLAAFIMIAATFFGCLRFSGMNRMFCCSWLTAIGVWSYSLYLLHQNIGVTLIAVIASALSLNSHEALAVPIVVAAALIPFSGLIYRYWEHPMNRRIVTRYRRFHDTKVPVVAQ